MDYDDHLLRHLDLCKRIITRLRAEGRFPWSDSPERENLVDSGDNPPAS